MEEQSLQCIMQAFEGIETMLKSELRALEDALTAISGDSHALNSLVRKVRTVGNLSKTLGGLMRNIVGEVRRGREDLVRTVEDAEDMCSESLSGSL
jgi:hypothetical protein